MPQGEYLQYGGQAIIEGVMMRSPRYFSVACRAPNGEIVLRTEAIEKTWIGRQKWLKKPFLRGTLALLDAMSLGLKAMKFSSNVQLDPAYQPEGSSEGEKMPSGRVQDFAVGATIVISILFGVALFQYTPNLLSQNLQRIGWGGTAINFATELIKIGFFIGYIWLISRMKEIQEVFKYHGAEHKAINTLEAEQELNLENCKRQTRLHPRCGTSFAIVVLLIGLVVFTWVPRYPFGYDLGIIGNATVRFLIEIPLLFPIAGLAYELIRWAGRFKNQAYVRALFWPGLMTQYLTTREPEERHIEVALEALRAVAAAETSGTAEEPVRELEPAAQIA